MGNPLTQQAPLDKGVEARIAIQLPENGVPLADVERELVRQAMERTGGNQTRAAELLGLERDALRRRLIKFGLLSHAPQTSVGSAQDSL